MHETKTYIYNNKTVQVTKHCQCTAVKHYAFIISREKGLDSNILNPAHFVHVMSLLFSCLLMCVHESLVQTQSKSSQNTLLKMSNLKDNVTTHKYCHVICNQ